ncbi:MAG: prolyl oligopeptidase family serine peptidase [Acidobacteria bacterium]|nr:prolyl oligopeptidase family serine peptidase [Acidobacteriota bacterium]
MIWRLLKLALFCVVVGSTPAAWARHETGFLDRTVTFAGVEYRYEVYVPRDWTPQRRWPVMLALHGGGEYGTDGLLPTVGALAKAIRQHPNRFPAIVIFPHAHPGGLGWQGTNGEVAMKELDGALAEFHGDPARVYLTGYSAGGNGAWWLAYHYPHRFAAAVIISSFATAFRGKQSNIDYPQIAPTSAADPYAELARGVSPMPIWLVHGDEDKNVSVEESRHMYAALKAAGDDVHFTELPSVDHAAWDPAYQNPDIAVWLFMQRQR